MRREHSGNTNTDMHSGNDLAYSTSGSVYLSDDEHDTCSQTGEEFSRNFLRTRSSPPPPIRVMRYLDDQVHLHGEGLDGDFEYDVQRDNLRHQLRHEPGTSAVVRNVPDESRYCRQGSSPFHPLGSPPKHYVYRMETVSSSFPPKMKLLCSFGGRILPRPNDGKLRYVGGETRIISMKKISSFAELVKKTNEIFNQPHTIKYQLPGEDLDSLISVSSDEDLHHMIEEHLERGQVEGCHRLRIFLVPLGDSETSHSFELKHTPQNKDYPYFVAVNGTLDRSPLKSLSEQNMASKVGHYPDYSFGLHHEASVPYLSVSPRTPTKGLYHSPPLSPAAPEHRDSHRSSHLCYYEEHSFTNALEQVSSHVFEQHAYGNSYFTDPSAFYHDTNHVPQTMIDSRYQNIHYMENQESHRTRETSFPDISPRRDFIPYTSHFQRPVTEWELHSHSNRVQGLSSEFNVIHGSNSEITEPVLLHHGEVSRDYIEKQLLPSNLLDFEAEKSPTLALSSTSDECCQQHEISDKSLSFTVRRNDEERYIAQTPSPVNAGYVSQAPDIGAVSSEEVYHTKECFPSCSIHHVVKPEDCHKDASMKMHSDATQNSLAESSNDWHSDITEPAPVIKNDAAHLQPEDPMLLNKRFVQDKLGSRSASSGQSSKIYASDSKYEDTKEEQKNESFSDAAIAEIEAGVYGLQIIKDADLEELQELGSGTFGTVYHGKWRGTDVAIKRIKKSCFDGKSSEQERLIKDFWREAQILSKLHHPNVLAFYGVVPDGPGGTLATVTEYMVNGSLKHGLARRDRALDRRRKLLIATDAACGMEYLHMRNIVHFDLKCDNLLVNLRDAQRPICKVGDFGLSRIKRNTLVTGGVRGTLPWMAPELLDGSSNKVSEKVDVFSFGIALWELLTGEEPYVGMHCGAIIGGIVSNTLRPVIPQRCDPQWKTLMEECWSADPAARPTFTEIAQRLRGMSKKIEAKSNGLHTKVNP